MAQGAVNRSGAVPDVPAFAALGLALVLWASAFAGIRDALHAYTPQHLALLRFLVASLALAAYAAATRMRLPERRDVAAIALTGFLGITVYHLALNAGEVTVTAGAASFLIALVPVFTALLGIAFLREHVNRWGWAGIVLSFAGVTLIAQDQKGGLHFTAGALLVVVAAIGESAGFILQKPLMRRYGALEFTTYMVWAGTIALLAFAPGLPAQVAAAPLRATLAVVYLGLFPGVLAYFVWSYALARLPTANAASVLYLLPPLSLLIAWVWLREILPLSSIAGGAIALLGVFLVNVKKRASAAERAATTAPGRR